MTAAFDQHPDAAIYRSQPGIASVLGLRVLGEFGDDPGRYADARARRDVAGTSPITRQSGKKKTVHARFVHDTRLVDALTRQAQGALTGSPGARAYYDRLRACGVGHQAAGWQLGEPAGRNPARLLTCPDPLRRGHRMGPHRPPAPDPAEPVAA